MVFEKVSDVKEVVEDVLPKFTVTNETTKESIQEVINQTLTDTGSTTVSVVVGELTTTEATTSEAGSISGSITIEAGDVTETVEINKTIEKLSKTDEEKAADAKKVVEAALTEVLAKITVANEVTEDDIHNKINKALANAGITDVVAAVRELTMTEATTSEAGSINVSIMIEVGDVTESVEMNKTIVYEIATKEDLEKLRDLVNAGNSFENIYLKLTADIDLGGSAGNLWVPIGTAGNPFGGIFDGAGHTVSGLYIDSTVADNRGLFGVNEGTVKNLTVSGDVTGKDNVGGIAGTNKGTIESCTNHADVAGNDNVGGIAGRNEGIIKGCTN
ncbi:MAG: hypothetical protein K2K09_05375, partial [Lachnospiraceae bacterium]|nr:hypothetical protein [Lachnospiraceae bacterium]